jgi:ubiquinone/menaquinone biosynthesis C-methylase UbiE
MEAWKKKRQVMHRYDVTARIYDMRYAEEQRAKIEAALKHVNLTVHWVLDAGCGTGVLFSHVSYSALNTVGLDFSGKTLRKAKDCAQNHESVHLLRADADNMPFKDCVFDAVFAMTLIQNVPSPSKTLKEIKRVARTDADIVVTGLKNIFEQSVLELLLKDAGLRVAAMETEGLKCRVAVCKTQPEPSDDRSV